MIKLYANGIELVNELSELQRQLEYLKFKQLQASLNNNEGLEYCYGEQIKNVQDEIARVNAQIRA